MINKTKQNNDQVLSVYLASINRYKLLKQKEEFELSKRISEGDKEARETLINSNLRLVVKIAKGYITPEMGIMDIIQEGNLGLMVAADKYDRSHCVRFSTYASCWIKQSIIRAISNKRRTIRVPYRKEETIRRLTKLKEEFIQNFSRNPSLKELASYARISEKELNSIIGIQSQIISLDSHISDSSTTLLDTLEDESYSPHSKFEEEDTKMAVFLFLSSLKEREQKVIKRRFAFNGNGKQTLKSIGKEIGISPETVRQIELKALKKLRAKAKSVRDYAMV